jgi:hypothetical protein
MPSKRIKQMRERLRRSQMSPLSLFHPVHFSPEIDNEVLITELPHNGLVLSRRAAGAV